MNKPPAFQFYAKDFLMGTSVLSTSEVGAYIRLLAWSWDNGPIPKDAEKRARIIVADLLESQRLWTAVMHKFDETDEGFINDRLEKERRKQRSYRRSQSRAGEAGAAARWPGGADDREKRSLRLAAARRLGTHTDEEWRALCDALGNACVACGETSAIVKDHIKPIYQGGSDAIENLQPMCRTCNSRKGPESRDLRQLNRLPQWLTERLAKCHTTPQTNDWLSSPICDLQPAGDQNARVTDADGRVLSDGVAFGNSRLRAAGLVFSAAEHRKCFPALDACARGWCIPSFLGQRWVAQSGRGDLGVGRREVESFIADELHRTPPGEIGDPLVWWKDRWHARHGKPAPKPPEPEVRRAVPGVDATEELLRQVRR